MKNTVLIIIAIITVWSTAIQLSSCTHRVEDRKMYKIAVMYYNGQMDTLTLAGYGENRFSLERGDLQHLRGVDGDHDIVASGVRKFAVLNIMFNVDSITFDKAKKLTYGNLL